MARDSGIKKSVLLLLCLDLLLLLLLIHTCTTHTEDRLSKEANFKRFTAIKEVVLHQRAEMMMVAEIEDVDRDR